ncbi:MAG: hypothetical protein M4579_007156 [Chaenotheca gracillima]|nr:MAG: hypothetical protein M4579_007156 [Chaenotheca gracillima]
MTSTIPGITVKNDSVMLGHGSRPWLAAGGFLFLPTLERHITVGVAAVGYSFGRPQASSLHHNNNPTSSPSAVAAAGTPPTAAPSKRKSFDHGPESMPYTSPPPSSASYTTPAGPVETASNPSALVRPGVAAVDSHGGTAAIPRTNVRRKTSTDITHVPVRPDALVHEQTAHTAEDGDAPLRDRPTANNNHTWLRRRSPRPLSSNPSPTSSPGLNAPSLTFSSGSAVPMLREGPAHLPLAPNKLVKRTSSLHTPSRKASMPIVGRSSKVPTLRRPATSHQRSATIQQQSLFGSLKEFEEGALPSTAPVSQRTSFMPTEISDRWQFYFDPKFATKPNDVQHFRRDSNSFRMLDAKRIHPSTLDQPTLVKSSEISSSPVDELASLTLGDRSDTFVFGSSRPTTPLGFGPRSRPAVSEGSKEAEPTSTTSSRRSFSISDMIGGSRPSWMHRTPSMRTKRPVPGGSAPAAQRYTSMPMSAERKPVPSSLGPRKSSRRNITDPAIFQDVKRSSSPAATQLAPPSPLPPIRRLSSFNPDIPREMSSPVVSTPGTPLQPEAEERLGSKSSGRSQPLAEGSRNHRVSLVSPSDRASTLVDSDNDFGGSPGADEEELDFQSETVFDSLRTRATSSSSGVLGPRIETIFDESPPLDKASKGSDRTLQIYPSAVKSISPETEENRNGLLIDNGMTRQNGHLKNPDPVINPTKRVWGEQDAENVNPPWLVADDEEDDDWDRDEAVEVANRLSSPQSFRALTQFSPSSDDAFRKSSSSGQQSNGHADKEALRNIFHWSEQASHESLVQDEADSRPRTVHGKHSRTNGRRRPSALHVRRQSISVVADPKSQLESDPAASRFATWGFGSKGPSEDWNEDFDFDLGGDQEDGKLQAGADAKFAMVVPQAIRERQASVIGHLCHIKEFALLVEDLKRLRVLASSKGIVQGSSTQLWKEADGIIDLASVENDSESITRARSPPASPTTSREAASQRSPAAETPNAHVRSPSGFSSDSPVPEPVETPIPGRKRRKSILGIDDDIFGGAPNTPTLPTEAPSKFSTPTKVESVPNDTPPAPGASAVARSVIESIHQRRTTSDPLLSTSPLSGPQHKTQFDTTTLRDLVAHVSVLCRKLAEVVRHADEESTSPHSSTHSHGGSRSPQLSPAPSLSQILAESVASSPSFGGSGRLPRSKSSNNTVSAVSVSGGSGEGNELGGGHLPMMAVV